MNQEIWAQEQLITIRSLMERASLYRAISAPGAVFSGVVSGLAAFLFPGRFLSESYPASLSFIIYWTVIFFVVSLFNFLFLSYENKKLGTPLLSHGMRSALTDFCPPLLAGCVIGLLLALDGYSPSTIVLVWCVCYGLALLSTRHYAPRSLLFLGWAFLIAGLGLTTLTTFSLLQRVGTEETGNLLMALSFGLFHLVYGAATWLTNRREIALRDAPAIEM